MHVSRTAPKAMAAEDTAAVREQSAVSALHILGCSGHVVEKCPAFSGAALPVRKHVVQAHAPVAPDLLERDLLAEEVPNQEGPGDVQQLGSLLGGELPALWDQGDRRAPAHG